MLVVEVVPLEHAVEPLLVAVRRQESQRKSEGMRSCLADGLFEELVALHLFEGGWPRMSCKALSMVSKGNHE